LSWINGCLDGEGQLRGSTVIKPKPMAVSSPPSPQTSAKSDAWVIFADRRAKKRTARPKSFGRADSYNLKKNPAPWRNYSLERFPAERNHSVEKKSLQIQKLEHILIAQFDST
jgi:hypothetical protein